MKDNLDQQKEIKAFKKKAAAHNKEVMKDNFDQQKEIEAFKLRAAAHNKEVMEDINNSFKAY